MHGHRRAKRQRQGEEDDDIARTDVVKRDHRIELRGDEIAVQHSVPQRVREEERRNLRARLGEHDDAARALEVTGDRVEIGRSDVAVCGLRARHMLRVQKADRIVRGAQRGCQILARRTEARALLVRQPDRRLKLAVAVIAERLREPHDRRGVDLDAFPDFAQRRERDEFGSGEKCFGQPPLLAWQRLEATPDLREGRIAGGYRLAC